MDNLFGAMAMPTPDTPLLHNDEAKATEIRAADDAAAAIVGLASDGAPPQLVIQGGPTLYVPPQRAGLDTLNAIKPLPGGFVEAGHQRVGPVRRLLRRLMPMRDV